MTALFTLEVIIKVLAHGLIKNGPNSYLKNSWNILDFTIVVLSLLALAPSGKGLEILKVIRLSRVLKPIRLISKHPGLKISIKSLLRSVPAIVNLTFIVFFFYILFSIVAVHLFRGYYNYCDTSGVQGLGSEQIRSLIDNEFDCLNYGGEWSKYYTHMDDIWHAMK